MTFSRLASCAVSLALAGCAGIAPPTERLIAACPGLVGLSVAPSAIGLPSGAARIGSAAFVQAVAQSVAGNASTPATPDHCRLLGTIAPVDPAAQLINFQLNLPIAWNGKVVQYGGGGYNGTLVTGLAPLRDAAPATRFR